MQPVQPKYTHIRDVSIIFNSLRSSFPFNSFSLDNLILRLVTLLALSTAHRAQTLSKIIIHDIRETPRGLEIKIDESIKTSGSVRHQSLSALLK